MYAWIWVYERVTEVCTACHCLRSPAACKTVQAKLQGLQEAINTLCGGETNVTLLTVRNTWKSVALTHFGHTNLRQRGTFSYVIPVSYPQQQRMCYLCYWIMWICPKSFGPTYQDLHTEWEWQALWEIPLYRELLNSCSKHQFWEHVVSHANQPKSFCGDKWLRCW